MSETRRIPAEGLPDNIDFVVGGGRHCERVFECRGCGERYSHPSRAREHDCPLQECPVCGHRDAHPGVGPRLDRVDECDCGVVYRPGGGD